MLTSSSSGAPKENKNSGTVTTTKATCTENCPMEISKIVPGSNPSNCKFTSNKNYNIVQCADSNILYFQNPAGETFEYSLPADIQK